MDFPFSRDKLPLLGGAGVTMTPVGPAPIVAQPVQMIARARSPAAAAQLSAPAAETVARPYVPAGLPAIPKLGQRPPTVPGKGSPGGSGNPLGSAGEGSMDVGRYFGGDVAGWQASRLGGDGGDPFGRGDVQGADFSSGRGLVYEPDDPGGGPRSDGQPRDEGAYSHRSKDKKPFIPGLGDQLNTSMLPFNPAQSDGAPSLKSGPSGVTANPFGTFTSGADLGGQYGRDAGQLRPGGMSHGNPFGLFGMHDPTDPGGPIGDDSGPDKKPAASGPPPESTQLKRAIVAGAELGATTGMVATAVGVGFAALAITKSPVVAGVAGGAAGILVGYPVGGVLGGVAGGVGYGLLPHQKPRSGGFPADDALPSLRPVQRRRPPRSLRGGMPGDDPGSPVGPQSDSAVPSDEPRSPAGPHSRGYIPSDDNGSPVNPRSRDFMPGDETGSPISPRTRVGALPGGADGGTNRAARDVYPDPDNSQGPTGPRL